MATVVWDAYGSLSIIARGSHEVKCPVFTEFNERCRLPSSGSSQQIHAILDRMEGRPPHEALGALTDLAALCLCSNIHPGYANKVAWKWSKMVQNAGRVCDAEVARSSEVSRLERALLEKGTENHDLQEEIERLRAQVQDLSTPASELQIDGLRTELAGEREKSALAADELQKARQKCMEVETEYQQMRLESKQQTDRMAQQLATEREALKIATKNHVESSITSSRLAHALSKKDQWLKALTAKDNDTQEFLTTAVLQLHEVMEKNLRTEHEMDRVRSWVDAMEKQIMVITSKVTSVTTTLCAKVVALQDQLAVEKVKVAQLQKH